MANPVCATNEKARSKFLAQGVLLASPEQTADTMAVKLCLLRGNIMRPDKPPSLEELEAEVKKTTSTKYQRELSLMTNVIQSYIDGFNVIASFTLADDNEVQHAWLLLITQSFRAMRCALLTMHIGYYGEAMSLLRTATEAWLAAEDCKKTPRTLNALLHNEELELKWGNIAENIGAREIVYEGDYHYLCRFTHVCKLSLAILTTPETNELRNAPIYDELLFLICCEMLIRNAIRMAPIMHDFLSKQPSVKLDSWLKTAALSIQEAGDWLEGQENRYGGQEQTSE